MKTDRPYKLIWRTALVTLLAAGLLAALAAATMMRKGWYNVGAVKQHWHPTFTMLELGLRYSVRHHARGVEAPALTTAMAQRGAQIYARHCVQCHGAPGVAPGQASLGLQPTPGPLVNMPQRWQPNELYWIVSNGIKMTGMPAWRFRLTDEDIWDVVAVIEQLPRIAPAEGVVLFGGGQPEENDEKQGEPAHPDAKRGRIALSQYACQSCHLTPGVPGASIDVGPSLYHLRQRRYIAGYLPNTEENLVRWIRFPTAVKPGTAMPSLQVSERDAWDIAQWLLSDEAQKP